MPQQAPTIADLNAGQCKTFVRALSGKNVFVTGAAGTGTAIYVAGRRV